MPPLQHVTSPTATLVFFISFSLIHKHAWGVTLFLSYMNAVKVVKVVSLLFN